MNLPPSIKINGVIYTIKYIDFNNDKIKGHSIFGSCDTGKLEICIDNKIHKSKQARTLLHEILEIILIESSLEFDHDIIKTLEIGLFNILETELY